MNNDFRYGRFDHIDGSHDLKKAVPDAFVDYSVRMRPGGRVAYFNFDLAKEMGLIPKNHPEELNFRLEKKILETFALVIVNEYDLEKNIEIPKDQIKKNKYMATRYLQLQHPSRKGATSGDGRSIWNGQILSPTGMTWDVSSCGTGATCLSPATALHQKYFRTGDPRIAYGCGYASFSEGLNAALMSEIFYHQNTQTERTLALIYFEGGKSINVRAAPNLVRPSHLFRYLKQENHVGLKSFVDYYLDREMKNKKFTAIRDSAKRYENFLNRVTESFGAAVARFESEYIFCWMTWDGDNILLSNAGIIDYGSVRQFGLYHKEYRYDDVDRLSTNLPEQKQQARYLVQTFAQMIDFLNTGRKKPIESFKCHRAVEQFEKNYLDKKYEYFLTRVGLSLHQRELMMTKHRAVVAALHDDFRYFEEKQSARGVYRVSDGLTSNAVFCMRDVLRDLPQRLQNEYVLSADSFIELAKSSYAKRRDLVVTPFVNERLERFQMSYRRLVEKLSSEMKMKQNDILRGIAKRSLNLNRVDAITGDGIIRVSSYLARKRKLIGLKRLAEVMRRFIKKYSPRPEEALAETRVRTKAQELERLSKIIRENREGI